MRRFVISLLALVGVEIPAQPATAYDRSRPPRLSEAAPLTVPVVRSAVLSNGIVLRVVTERELPVLHLTALIEGGAHLDGRAPGIATFMAGMLDEGAGSRDAAALQSEVAFLGASLSTRATWDGTQISLKVPVRSLGPALELFADVLLRPTFSSIEVRRQRDLRLATLLQSRDQPNVLAALAFEQILFPAGHPYHESTVGDSATTAALDSAALRSFYDRTVRPERTTLFIAGDITAAQARAMLDPLLGNWRATAPAMRQPAIKVSPVLQTSPHLFLLDKPEAAQSVITIGWPGVDRRSPDYAPLMVMNTILGGSFTSRLNMTLRETKGYSYGASSRFAFRRIPGPFSASAAVRTDVTDSSLVEFFRELHAIRSTRVPGDELARAKAYVELGLPSALEGTTQIAGQMTELATFGLALPELGRFSAAVRRVTASEVLRVARKYLAPDQATVVVVGDLTKVRASITALRLGPVTELDLKQVAR
jgi:predicted Zn-dependent peptidase